VVVPGASGNAPAANKGPVPAPLLSVCWRSPALSNRGLPCVPQNCGALFPDATRGSVVDSVETRNRE